MIEEISLDGFQTAHFTEHSSLAERRIVLGLTQKQVADKLGVLPKTVSKWETVGGITHNGGQSARSYG